jgi:hypothetical protein
LVGHSSAPASVAVVRSANTSNADQIASMALKGQAAWSNPYARSQGEPRIWSESNWVESHSYRNVKNGIGSALGDRVKVEPVPYPSSTCAQSGYQSHLDLRL